MDKHPYLKIVRSSVFTLFNLVNVILAVMVMAVGSYKNTLFLGVAIANTLISIINNVRAQKIIDKLKLISEQKPTIEKNGQTYQIAPEKVQKGDTLILGLGDQVLYDSAITSGSLEVNESFITGEQDTVVKNLGDHLISGSFVVAGQARAKVEKIGSENSLNKLEAEAHQVKTADSQLFSLMNKIVKYISYALIPIGALLLWARFRAEADTATAVTSTVAALVSMIPEGLILLTSSILALATIRLSRQKVLVQDLYAIETLARVDTLCLDKTGTLTTGHLRVVDVIPAPSISKNTLCNAIEAILSLVPADNATSTALHAKFATKPAKALKTQKAYELIPFSSERKYSGIRNDQEEILMGALEFLTDDPEVLKLAPETTNRVLAVVKAEKDLSRAASARPIAMGERRSSSPCQAPEALQKALLGFIVLEDEIRKDARNIIKFFYGNDVDLKVISGDNAVAVQSVAEKVGIKNPEVYDFSSASTHDYAKIAANFNIFARVTPAQKKSLVEALKKQGRTVAMTGDGVNDILAMKEADCSIAIGNGSDAARRSAKIVLLNSDFSAVPSIIAEGRQSINNLERSTSLFLAKTVYAAILAVVFCVVPLEYPFSPIEMTLLNFTCIGLPGVVLALEPNISRIKNQFVHNIKHYSVPTGIAVAIAAITLSILAEVLGWSHGQLIFTSLLATFVIDLALIIRIAWPPNKLRVALVIVIILIMIGACAIPFLRELFDLTF